MGLVTLSYLCDMYVIITWINYSQVYTRQQKPITIYLCTYLVG